MITIVVWKWDRIKTGYQLPAVCDYTAEHVNTMARMIERNVTVPYRFVCVTDDKRGIECETVKMPRKYRAGGCYHRLYEFSDDFRQIAGDRFLRIDLDTVITRNIDHILTMRDEFVINKYVTGNRVIQYYNGALVLMTTGSRRQVWDTFNPAQSPKLMAKLNQSGYLIGSDQAWISYVLKGSERMFTDNDGVYAANKIQNCLPDNACIVLFSGKRDPTQLEYNWVRTHYR